MNPVVKKLLLPVIIIAFAGFGAFLIFRGNIAIGPQDAEQETAWAKYATSDSGVTFEYPPEWVVREFAPFIVFVAPSEEIPITQSPIAVDVRGDIGYENAVSQLKAILKDITEETIEINGLTGLRFLAVISNAETGDISVVSTVLNYQDRAVVLNLTGINREAFEEEKSVYLRVVDSLNITSLPELFEPSVADFIDKLEKVDLVEGDGQEVKGGDTLSVHYVGTLENGDKFDSSLDRGEPFEFVLGAGQVIPGWDLGLVGMRTGGKRKLVIPPELAYGNQERGNIPANSTLIFEVELLEIK